MSTKKLTDKCSLQFSSLSPQSGNNPKSASRHMEKEMMAYSYSRTPHYQKRGKAANTQDSELVSVFMPWGKKPQTNTFRVHLQGSWLLVVFKTVSLQDQASLNLIIVAKDYLTD